MKKIAMLVLVTVLCGSAAAAQPPFGNHLKVVDDLGTEVGFYVGIRTLSSGRTVNGIVVRFVPATNRWVVLVVNPDVLALNPMAGLLLRYESTDCSGQPYLLTGILGPPQIASVAVGGAGGIYYYRAGNDPITIFERSIQQFATAGGLNPCAVPSFPGLRENAIPAAVVDLSGLFVPPFRIQQ